MSVVIQQQQTDMVEVEHLDGGVSLLTFAWESREADRAPQAVWARTSEVEEALATAREAGAPPVSALADPRAVSRWSMLRDDPTVPDILRATPLEVVEQYSWRRDGGLPSIFVEAAEGGSAVDAGRLYRYDSYDGTLISFETDRPAVRALRVSGPTAEHFRLDQAAAVLAEHPWVLRVSYSQGRPGNYDHVPAFLMLDVLVPQEALDSIAAGGRGLGSYEVGLALVEAVVVGRGPLGEDPLGLAGARLDKPAREPQEDWEYAETYSALASTLPSPDDWA